jgi:hypothetical protein
MAGTIACTMLTARCCMVDFKLSLRRRWFNTVLKYVSSTASREAGFNHVDDNSIAMSIIAYIVVVTNIQFTNMQNNSNVTARYDGNEDVCAADDKLPFEADGSSKMLQAKSALLHQLTGN